CNECHGDKRRSADLESPSLAPDEKFPLLSAKVRLLPLMSTPLDERDLGEIEPGKTAPRPRTATSGFGRRNDSGTFPVCTWSDGTLGWLGGAVKVVRRL